MKAKLKAARRGKDVADRAGRDKQGKQLQESSLNVLGESRGKTQGQVKQGQHSRKRESACYMYLYACNILHIFYINTYTLHRPQEEHRNLSHWSHYREPCFPPRMAIRRLGNGLEHVFCFLNMYRSFNF